MNAPVRALIFDIGQVIVRVNPERAAAAFAANAGLTTQQILATIQTDPQMREFQEGRRSPRQWHEHLCRRMDLRLSFAEFRKIWNSALDPQTILHEDLFAQLAAHHSLVLLSNTDPIHVEHMTAHFTFLRHFPARVYSCTEGTSKPAPTIYRTAIAHTGVEPQHILYIDDVPDYVAAGLRTGMQAHHFKAAPALLAELRTLTILR